MDGREGLSMNGSNSYYLYRGVTETQTSLNAPIGFRPLLDPSFLVESNVRDSSVGSTFQVENPLPNFPNGLHFGVPSGNPVKKKRGRPRKYGPNGANMSLGLSPMTPSLGSMALTPKGVRGRPRGSGRKQQLAHLGEWMNNSAGLAFTPHVINIAVGEDISAKVLLFSQQKPRALCILSANGVVSKVTLRQPTSSDGTITYEGRFEILCLSGSYLPAESGGPKNRTGGLSVSLCSPDGYAIGGGLGGKLIAASPVQVVVCSFVYGGKTKNKTEAGNEGDEIENSKLPSGEKSATPATQNVTVAPNSARSTWPVSWPDLSNPQTEIDLMRR